MPALEIKFLGAVQKGKNLDCKLENKSKISITRNYVSIWRKPEKNAGKLII